MMNDETVLIYLERITFFRNRQGLCVESSRHNSLKSTWVICADQSRYRVIQQADGRGDFVQADGVKRMQERGLTHLRCLHHDVKKRLAVYNWLPGSPIFLFDQIDAASTLTGDRMKSLIHSLVEIHSESSMGFSLVTDEPSYQPDMRGRWQLLPPNAYSEYMLRSFTESWEDHLLRARSRLLINEAQWRELMFIQRECRKKIEGGIGILDSVETFSFLHGDLTPENIICHDSEIAFIDFEFWHYGDRAVELAFLLEQLHQADALSSGRESEFVESYQRELEALGVVDRYFLDRLSFFSRYVLWKFLVLVADGLTTAENGSLNLSLYNNLLCRSSALLKED